MGALATILTGAAAFVAIVLGVHAAFNFPVSVPVATLLVGFVIGWGAGRYYSAQRAGAPAQPQPAQPPQPQPPQPQPPQPQPPQPQ